MGSKKGRGRRLFRFGFFLTSLATAFVILLVIGEVPQDGFFIVSWTLLTAGVTLVLFVCWLIFSTLVWLITLPFIRFARSEKLRWKAKKVAFRVRGATFTIFIEVLLVAGLAFAFMLAGGLASFFV
jgi:hypothetical protein